MPKNNHRNRPDKPARRDNAPPGPTSCIAGWKAWFFRLLAFIAAPVVFWALCELGLRLAGVGYPTEFLLPSSRNGQKTFIQNNKFCWRFLGPQLARLPYPLCIEQPKPPGTIRIFVLGESAAKGEPKPYFGLPRMLLAMLSLRHPGTRFEVENAAVTAINSHVILPIARDCAAADGDFWVIYMGNNEVVGPFGAGTVFGSQTPPLPFIRGAIALKATRLGQFFDAVLQWTQKKPSQRDAWGGMKMFLHEQVRADDPRMEAVYRNFKRNLADIIQTGRKAGVGIVVSTVAVNLKDCAPFGSEHRPDLSERLKATWEKFYQLGIAAQQATNHEEAAGYFREAAQIDDTFADLRFRQAECALALGRTAEASQNFQQARELDTLRFRCDRRLNDLTRQTAANRQSERILLADAESAFARESPDGLPGGNLFYEHVHPNFAGNYLLARTIAEQLEKLLPEQAGGSADPRQPWPTAGDCARRLGWSDWARLDAEASILDRLQEPPFTAQLNNDAQKQQLQELLNSMRPATSPQGIREARQVCEKALAEAPDEPELLNQLASLQEAAGDFAGAAATERRSLELRPSSGGEWQKLGEILVRLGQREAAVDALERSLALDPQDVDSLANLAQTMSALGRRAEAIVDYRRAVRLQPRFSFAWIGLGETYEAMGRRAEAEDCYHKALAGHLYPWESEVLAHFCERRGWLEAAATNYSSAIQTKPSNVRLRIAAGQNLVALKRYAEAGEQFSEAARLQPGLAEAHYFYGSVLGVQGKPAAAAEQFNEALRLKPDLLEARINLGAALMNSGRDAEALAQFEEVLQRCPTNVPALQAVQFLRARNGSGGTH